MIPVRQERLGNSRFRSINPAPTPIGVGFALRPESDAGPPADYIPITPRAGGVSGERREGGGYQDDSGWGGEPLASGTILNTTSISGLYG